MTTLASTRTRCLCSFGCILLLAGCGGGSDDSPPRAAVNGTVLLDDVPLPTGIIRFVPKDETPGPKLSDPITGGEFTLPAELGPWVGTHRVEIESTDLGGLAPDDETAVVRLQAQGIKRIERIEIPPSYNRRSTLEATILADQENELEFKLTSTPNLRH